MSESNSNSLSDFMEVLAENGKERQQREREWIISLGIPELIIENEEGGETGFWRITDGVVTLRRDGSFWSYMSMSRFDEATFRAIRALPEISTKIKTPRIENWSRTYYPDRDAIWTSPEYRMPCLQGFIINHPNPKIDPKINGCTSRIVGKVRDKVVTESGTMYELGTIDPEYEKLYNNARERLFNSLPEMTVPES